MAHHSLVDEKHHHTRDLRQDGRDAQLNDQVEFLSAGQRPPVAYIPQQHVTFSAKNLHEPAKLVQKKQIDE